MSLKPQTWKVLRSRGLQWELRMLAGWCSYVLSQGCFWRLSQVLHICMPTARSRGLRVLAELPGEWGAACPAEQCVVAWIFQSCCVRLRAFTPWSELADLKCLNLTSAAILHCTINKFFKATLELLLKFFHSFWCLEHLSKCRPNSCWSLDGLPDHSPGRGSTLSFLSYQEARFWSPSTQREAEKKSVAHCEWLFGKRNANILNKISGP